MAHKSAEFLVAVLASTALVLSPVAAQAGGMSHYGMGSVPSVPQLRCPEVPHPQNHPVVINKPATTNIENNVNIYKPTNIQNNVNVYKPVTVTNNINESKNIEINKPITVYKTINENKNININNNINENKNININKNINNSKNININKNIVINKGSSESEAIALALAEAVAAAAASSNSSASATGGNASATGGNVSVNFSGSATANASSNSAANAAANAAASTFSNSASFNNNAFFGAVGASSYVAEAPGFVAPGEINVNVSPAEVVAASSQVCTYQEATVIKAIHAICVSEDHHEFPASHMLGDTWINAGYEGEIARCLPGSSLKVTVGSVIQSTQGAAVSNARGETLICAPHEALRHFKDGVLKCAPAMPVPDCTERTNLRKFGTGDMFFSYVTKVCLETGREFVGGETREFTSTHSYSYGSGY